MARLTPQQRLDNQMLKLKDMGITISVTPAARDGFEDRPLGIIADAARRHGIYEGPSDGDPG